ncbi:MAG: hypothetical protein ER33_00520 [Cyanobium sp. CACIAM 14]|nr:MAG: hypothetical protein ER33_00520 [Cyanobium sp. CACIAM 14]
MAIPAAAGSAFTARTAATAGAVLLTGLQVLAPLAAGAQQASPNQPLAIPASPGLSPPACPLVVPPQERSFQPLRIAPAQVTNKNRMGCLSAADAIYGPDGCPTQLCGNQRGQRVPLP